MPSAREVTQPLSASALRCRLTVDCGNCSTLHSSGHRQFLRLEEQQQPVARDVGQRGQVVEDGLAGRVGINP